MIKQTTLDSLVGYRESIVIDENKNYVLPINFILSDEDSIIFVLDSLSALGWGSSENYFERIIHQCKAKANKNYRFELRVYKSIPELNKTNPELLFQTAPVAMKREMLKAEIDKTVSKFILYVTIVIFILVSIPSIFILKKQPNPQLPDK